MKNPVTPPGIDAGTVRLVAQRLNHYATPGPMFVAVLVKNTMSVPVVVILREALKPGPSEQESTGVQALHVSG